MKFTKDHLGRYAYGPWRIVRTGWRRWTLAYVHNEGTRGEAAIHNFDTFREAVAALEEEIRYSDSTS